MPDEIVTSDSGGASPTAETASSSTGVDSSALAADSNATETTQADVSTASATDNAPPPSDDSKYEVPENANLEQVRQAHRELLNDHRAIKQTTQTYEPWKSVIDQYQKPEQIEPLLQIAQGLFASQTNDQGQQVDTTMPALQFIHEQSPNTIFQLADDLANFTLEGRSVFDWQVDAFLADKGLTQADLDTFKTLKEQGGLQSVATSDVSAEDLAQVAPKYQEVFKKLSPDVRNDLLLSTELTREQFLQNAVAQEEAQSWFQQQQQERQTAAQQAEREQQQAIGQAQDAAVNETWSSTFNALSQDLVSKGFKPSADDNVNSLYQVLVLAGIHSTTNPALAAIVKPLFEASGIKANGEEIGSLLNQVEVAAKDAVRYEKTGDQVRARQSVAARDRANFQLKTLAGGISAQIIEVLNGTATEKRLAQESRLAGATSRFVPSGQASNGNGDTNPFRLPPGVKPYSDEARQFQAQLLANGR